MSGNEAGKQQPCGAVIGDDGNEVARCGDEGTGGHGGVDPDPRKEQRNGRTAQRRKHDRKDEGKRGAQRYGKREGSAVGGEKGEPAADAENGENAENEAARQSHPQLAPQERKAGCVRPRQFADGKLQ